MIQLVIGTIAVLFLAFLWREYKRQSALRDAANELYRNLRSTSDLFAVRKDEPNKLRLDT